jgi:prolyl oligopeptidase
MPTVMESPPYSQVEAVTEIFHGIPVTDPYRWLEDQESPRTRKWLAAQAQYARCYFASVPARARIRERVRELLDVETYESLLKVGNRYFFRKRLLGQEQHCIYFREGLNGQDELLIDPAARATGPHTAVKPLHVSPNGRWLLYEKKQGGERSGTFELLDVDNRERLPDALPRGYLRGFAFTPDSQAFYYVHEPLNAKRPLYRAAFKHTLGTGFAEDDEVFVAGEDKALRLYIAPGWGQLGFLVVRFVEKPRTDFYLWKPEGTDAPEPIIWDAEYKFGPLLLKDGRILAITDRDAPTFRIVEVCPQRGQEPEFKTLVGQDEAPIQNWMVSGSRIVVSYLRQIQTEIDIFDLAGKPLGQLPVPKGDTVRLLAGSEDTDELLFEQESFTKPIQIRSYRHDIGSGRLWAERRIPCAFEGFGHIRTWFPAKDGIHIPMFLVGRHDVLDRGPHPTIMTSYGGFGVSMTPQFSVFVTYLMERGCLFALPNIRGGSEFGVEWHHTAKRRNRQVAFDDFLSAAQRLIDDKRTAPQKLAIFGGSNSGLLVAAAMTQRPDLFRAVICMAPLLDMLRYHLFDDANVWQEEFGTAYDSDDFASLLGYSPYHKVRDGVEYPAIMIVSGDADHNCNPLHARKMTARMQAANRSGFPILLDYSRHRGHSPVLPLSERIEALTDRMAFLCDQLQLSV